MFQMTMWLILSFALFKYRKALIVCNFLLGLQKSFILEITISVKKT